MSPKPAHEPSEVLRKAHEAIDWIKEVVADRLEPSRLAAIPRLLPSFEAAHAALDAAVAAAEERMREPMDCGHPKAAELYSHPDKPPYCSVCDAVAAAGRGHVQNCRCCQEKRPRGEAALFDPYVCKKCGEEWDVHPFTDSHCASRPAAEAPGEEELANLVVRLLDTFLDGEPDNMIAWNRVARLVLADRKAAINKAEDSWRSRIQFLEGRVEVLESSRREMERAIMAALDKLGRPAHTYASENADAYRGFDAGVQRCREAIQRILATTDAAKGGE